MTDVLVIGPRLQELEAIIARGQKAFVEVGNALLEIRERRSYKERGYKSFDDYCREHWSFTKQRANQFVEAAKVVKELESTTMVAVLPESERQARELSRADDPVEVWAEVVEQHAPAEITAAVIREHVEARKAPVEVIEAAEVVADDPPFVVPEAELAAITQTVRVAVTAGATSGECYTAYQAGFSRS